MNNSNDLFDKDSEISPKFVYNKNQRLEEIDNKIADILSEAVYSYIIRKRLLKKRTSADLEIRKNP